MFECGYSWSYSLFINNETIQNVVVCSREERERAACIALFVFLLSCDSFPRSAMVFSAVCDCGFSDHTHYFRPFFINNLHKTIKSAGYCTHHSRE